MRALWQLALFASAALAGTPDVVDRVAVTVGNRAITSSHIEDEIRLTAFLNGDPLDFSPAQRRAAAARLVERMLLEREIEITRYTVPATDTAADALADIRARYNSPEAFGAALEKEHLTEAKLTAHLENQARMLLFIDFRFRPAVTVSEADARGFYGSEFPAVWMMLHPDMPLPLFEDARDDVERLLTDRRVDAEMDGWLKTAQAQTRVVYHDEAFQ